MSPKVYVSCFHSYCLFSMLDCMFTCICLAFILFPHCFLFLFYGIAYITLWLFIHTYSCSIWISIFFLLVFFNSEMLCFVFISVITTYVLLLPVHTKPFCNMKCLFNKSSINKQQLWSRINEHEYELHEFSAALWRQAAL